MLFTIEDKQSSNTSKDSTPEQKQFDHLKLPRYQLVTFNGELNSWLQFRDLFETTIDKNKTLTPVEKLQYLASSLTDQAAKLIKGFPITNESYLPAWQTLCDRFECKRDLAFAQINKLFSVKSIKSSKSIRDMLDSCNESLRNLKTLGYEPNPMVDLILIQNYQAKLDTTVREKWEFSLEKNTVPSFKDFVTFLEKLSRSSHDIKEPPHAPKYENKHFPKRTSVNNIIVKNQSLKCVLCAQGHLLFKCPEFNKLTLDQRWNVVKTNRICNNCLRTGHYSSKCLINSKCKVCAKSHHSLLHAFKPESTNNSHGTINQQTNANPENSHSEISNAQCFSNHIKDNTQILLSTALIKIRDHKGSYVTCRALIDSASQTSLVTKACCHKLNLPITETNHSIIGINDKVAETTLSKTRLNFSPHWNNESFNVSALIVNKVTTFLPNFIMKTANFKHLENLTLADPSYNIPSSVDVLLGADLYAELIQGQTIQGPPGSPIALKSKLGWLLSGRIYSQSGKSSRVLAHHTVLTLEDEIKRFWTLESIPSTFEVKDEDQSCETLYCNTTKRDSSGRFSVRLPFKEGPPLGESKGQAVRRFYSLENKLNRDPELKMQYVDFMREYLVLGHMKNIPESQQSSQPEQHYYVPHHCVLRQQSETSKLRVVFDCSAKTTTGVSLNDRLMIGPKIQHDLFNILLRFRTHTVAFSADVEKMFRQVLINQNDTRFQRIVWRENPSEPLKEYELLTVTYGSSCAPFLAIRTIQQLAKEESVKYPHASPIVLKDFYVDDLLSGAESVQEAQSTIIEINQLMNAGCFNLRKWSSSHNQVLDSIPAKNRSSDNTVKINEHKTINLLGLHWNPSRDTLQVQISTFDNVNTKRQLLSTITKIYDPLGFLTPTTIILKMMMQELWRDKLPWDEPVPPDIAKTWMRFNAQLSCLKQFEIQRCLKDSKGELASRDLYGFCDSSSKAYAAVLYLRTMSESGDVTVRLVAAKSRVAPLKEVTLPKLELCGALLLARLYKAVTLSIDNVNNVYLYSDSEISLCWIKSSSAKDPFIKNRVAAIRNLTEESSWHHISGSLNPADCATRGVMPNKLRNHPLWLNGPPFLLEKVVHIKPFAVNISLCNEIISNEFNPETPNPSYFITMYSSFSRLRRITALCLRFIQNCRVKRQLRKIGFLTSEELQDSTKRLVKLVQTIDLRAEIKSLKTTGSLPRNNSYLPLDPFIDEQGLVRVGGRLKHANLSWSTKHPLLLPKNNHLTKLIIQDLHAKLLHGGVELVLSQFRQQFWVPSGRSQVKKILKDCHICFRLRPRSIQPFMGNLPSTRVNPARAFQYTGVDLAGPIITKPNVKRSKTKLKSYIALFVCFVTKAIHLEAVADLSTSAFIAALRRFIARRGKPSEIQSDHGTNFQGSKGHLQELYKLYKSEPIQTLAADEEIKWSYIPPRAPHMGGIWEANIKSMKAHLIKTCKSKILTFEELTTLLTQIEACLNSRPLIPMSSDPSETEALTPAHFLLGAPLLSVPEPTVSSPNLLDHWKAIQSLRDRFWTRWSKEYIASLQPRTKWKLKRPDIKCGDLVLISDSNPAMKWPLARVIKLYPGDDGVTRVVDLKTSSGTFRRPVHKLCPLPVIHPGAEDGGNK